MMLIGEEDVIADKIRQCSTTHVSQTEPYSRNAALRSFVVYPEVFICSKNGASEVRLS